MSTLIPPHGGKGLVCRLLEGAELDTEKKKAEGLKKVEISPRENGDLIMMGIGAFSPREGFMTKADWKGVCENFLMADGTFWPVPVTLSCSKEDAEVLEYLYSRKHITLKGRASWGLGIVTGNNKKHIQATPSDGVAPGSFLMFFIFVF